MIMAYIYKITCDNSDKIYIGSTTSNINSRFSQHKAKYKKYNNYTRGKRCSWSTVFCLFELGNCKVELIEECDYKLRYEREKHYINLNKEKTINYLYNNETQCLSVNANRKRREDEEEGREPKEMD
jgi:hypothetical protein